MLEGIKGHRVVDLARMTPDVLAGILPRVYPQMLAVVREHQDAGRPCYIATAASQPAAEILAEALAMDGAIGTRWEIEDGVYTGRLDGPFAYGEGKAQRCASSRPSRGSTSQQSWAYSDAASDLPMLEAVGHPVAVNPDAGLAEVARREGWEVLRFEKLGERLRVGGGGRWSPPRSAAAAAGSRHGAGRARKRVVCGRACAKARKRLARRTGRGRRRSRTVPVGPRVVDQHLLERPDRALAVADRRPARAC